MLFYHPSLVATSEQDGDSYFTSMFDAAFPKDAESATECSPQSTALSLSTYPGNRPMNDWMYIAPDYLHYQAASLRLPGSLAAFSL